MLARRSLFAAVVLGALCASCSSLVGAIAPQPAGIYKSGSRPHGFQTSSFAYAFMSAHQAQWLGTLDKVERDALGALASLRDGGHAARIVMRPSKSSPDGTEHYDVDLEIVTKPGGKGGGKTFVIQGTAGMAPEQHDAMAAEAAKATGLGADAMGKAHFALYGLVNMLTALNASSDSLQRHAFALAVLEKKVSAGEKADWFDGNRPAAETIEDVKVALQIIAEHHATAKAWRAEILAMVAMASSHAVPGVLDELRGQIDESRGRAKSWTQTHTQPTVDDFGVKVSLPDANKMLQELEEKAGFLTAVAQVAKGVVTGSPSATLEGLAKLAPADSTVRIVLDGAAAASKGDVLGTIDAVGKLAGKEAEVDAVKSAVTGVESRLSRVQQAVAAFKSGKPGKAIEAVGGT